MICIVVVVAVAGLVALKRSRFGLAIRAMREDSLMASHQGIDVVRYRTALFALSGSLPEPPAPSTSICRLRGTGAVQLRTAHSTSRNSGHRRDGLRHRLACRRPRHHRLARRLDRPCVV
ncbi:hypothetical protein FXW78_03205 [Rhodococcus opacus]|nr:hypothetical protein [Rhodococcus opacus]